MFADNSTVLQFWPEIYLPMGESWMNREASSVELRTTYALLRTKHLSQLAGGNVSADLINVLVLLVNGPDFFEVPYCNEGWVRTTDDFYEYILAFPFSSLEVGEFNMNPFRELYSMAIGLFVWQRYNLRLAMQMDKLTVFGLRGRPPLPDIP